MKRQRTFIHERARIDLNAGLKATALTAILEVWNLPGRLLAIYCNDPDDLTQNERIQIIIDENVVFNDAAIDIPNTDYYLHLLACLAKATVVGGTSIATDTGTHLDDKGGLPFQYNLEVHYLRAAAGTTGLTINIVYATENDILIA